MTAFRGVYAILPTPFHDDLSLDIEGLREVVRFCIACGAHGVVSPANASEQPYLSPEERRRVTETVVAEARGRTHAIVGVTALTAREAAELARHASGLGADAVMAMPPYLHRPSDAEIRRYYEAIDAASGVPVFVQNWNGPGGTPMSASLVASLLRELKRVRFVKEETEFASLTMTAIHEFAGEACHGVMGGKAGRHLIEEFARGAIGTMPAGEVCDVHVALWDALDHGEHPRALEIYRRLLPLMLFETTYGFGVFKEVLRRRGVIRSAATRQTGAPVLDARAHGDLADILKDLSGLMNPAYPAKDRT